MTRLLFALLLALALPTVVHSQAPAARPQALTEAEKIQWLITTVEKSQGLRFIRNGSAHDSASAADHLRLKWKRAGKRIHTAEEFIRYCATGSSISGKPYQIQFADGHVEESAVYFHAQLRRIETGRGPPVRREAGVAKP